MGWKRELNVHWKHVFWTDVLPLIGALRSRVPHEFIASGLHKEKSTCLGIVSEAPDGRSSAGSVITSIFSCSIDRSPARSCCLMGIVFGSNIFSAL